MLNFISAFKIKIKVSENELIAAKVKMTQYAANLSELDLYRNNINSDEYRYLSNILLLKLIELEQILTTI